MRLTSRRGRKRAGSGTCPDNLTCRISGNRRDPTLAEPGHVRAGWPLQADVMPRPPETLRRVWPLGEFGRSGRPSGTASCSRGETTDPIRRERPTEPAGLSSPPRNSRPALRRLQPRDPWPVRASSLPPATEAAPTSMGPREPHGEPNRPTVSDEVARKPRPVRVPSPATTPVLRRVS